MKTLYCERWLLINIDKVLLGGSPREVLVDPKVATTYSVNIQLENTRRETFLSMPIYNFL